MVQRLNLTRDQLASFLQDHEQIKQFELLFSSTNANSILIDEVSINAGNANASANEALAQISAMQDDTQFAATNPVIDNNNKPVLDYIDFNLNAPHTNQSRRMVWNPTDQTLDLGMEYGVTQQIGMETFARVQNNTGVLIPNGSVVGFTGAVPDSALSVAPYLANGATNSLYVLGVMTHDLPDTGQKGYCTVWGFVRELNTSAFALGDILYASPTVAGGFTKVKPTAPNNVIPLAAVLKVGTTDGVIFVRPTIEQQTFYGEFSKLNSQTPAAINTAYAILLTNTEIANGVSLGTPLSRVVISQAGLYNIALSVQITSSNASQKSVRIWLRKNNTTDIPNSARLASTTLNNGYLVVTINETFSLLANEFIEVMYSTDDVNVSISTVAATAFAPAAPAVLLAVTQVEQ